MYHISDELERSRPSLRWGPPGTIGKHLWRFEPGIGWVPDRDPALLFAGVPDERRWCHPEEPRHKLFNELCWDLDPFVSPIDMLGLYSAHRCTTIEREGCLRGLLLRAAKRRNDVRRKEEGRLACQRAAAAMTLVALLSSLRP